MEDRATKIRAELNREAQAEERLRARIIALEEALRWVQAVSAIAKNDDVELSEAVEFAESLARAIEAAREPMPPDDMVTGDPTV